MPGALAPCPPVPFCTARLQRRPGTSVPYRRRQLVPARPAASGNGAAPGAAAATEPPLAEAAAATAAASNGSNGNGASSTASDPTTDAQVEQLRQEVGELRSLLIAQARLVQSQQRHIQQLESTVGQQGLWATVEEVGPVLDSAIGTTTPSSSNGIGSSSSTSGAAAGGSVVLEGIKAEEKRSNRLIESAALSDRRLTGLFDARYHSTAWGATPQDHRVLPRRIFLVRHAESEGNVDNIAYTYLPDPRVPLTSKGWQQAMAAGDKIKGVMDQVNGGKPYKVFFYTSPYLRSQQTYEGLAQAFHPNQVQGVQEEVQLREQDFGNFQGKKREKAERLRFGRFFYRFPNGESGADVYDRMTIFEDHLVRDINAGRFADNTSLVLVTHGLALRVFLMRWFHWTVDQFMCVFNPPNAEPLMLERITTDHEGRQGGPASWIHTKALYRLSDSSREIIKGCTEDMCQTSWAPRGMNPLDPADSMLL